MCSTPVVTPNLFQHSIVRKKKKGKEKKSSMYRPVSSNRSLRSPSTHWPAHIFRERKKPIGDSFSSTPTQKSCPKRRCHDIYRVPTASVLHCPPDPDTRASEANCQQQCFLRNSKPTTFFFRLLPSLFQCQLNSNSFFFYSNYWRAFSTTSDFGKTQLLDFGICRWTFLI